VNLPLPGGQSATLRDRLLYGQARSVRAALVAMENDPAAAVDLDMALVRAYVESWHVMGLDGAAVPLDTPELAPDDVVQAIAVEAIGIWRAAVLPKAGPGPSLSTLPESGLDREMT
jgi:hypothetical protein